jgi:hypothetical protein
MSFPPQVRYSDSLRGFYVFRALATIASSTSQRRRTAAWMYDTSLSDMDFRLHELKRSLELATDGMSSEQLSWHPLGKWCAGEVLEHLYLTYTGTIKGFERVMTSGKPLASRATIEQRLRSLVVVGLGRMPSGLEAPAIVQPKGLPADKVRNEITAKLVAMDEIITQAEERFGPRVYLLNHPILGPLTARQWRKLHLVHGRHHLKQLVQLRANATRQMD